MAVEGGQARSGGVFDVCIIGSREEATGGKGKGHVSKTGQCCRRSTKSAGAALMKKGGRLKLGRGRRESRGVHGDRKSCLFDAPSIGGRNEPDDKIHLIGCDSAPDLLQKGRDERATKEWDGGVRTA